MEYALWSRNALLSRIKVLEDLLTEHKIEIPVTSNTQGKEDDLQKKSSGVPSLDKFSLVSKPNQTFPTRLVALKFFYLGWNYHGLAYQRDGPRTVEGEIINTLCKTNLIVSSDLAEIQFSRCGRTDADVSARSQVISLQIRTVEPRRAELDYVSILNSNLPKDIRFYASCVNLPQDFDARFSCRGRTYRYFFYPRGLDCEMMQLAADKFVGSHDFRNFCKIDGSKQITNFTRTVLSAEIHQPIDNTGLAFLELKGTAFLWNQVRSMMAVLFMIGKGWEEPEVVDKLLNIEEWPCRPAYEIAPGVPLVLYDTHFDIEWEYSQAQNCEVEFVDYLHKLQMSQLMYITCLNGKEDDNTAIDGPYRPKKYTKLLNRPVRDAPEAANARWRAKKKSIL